MKLFTFKQFCKLLVICVFLSVNAYADNANTSSRNYAESATAKSSANEDSNQKNQDDSKVTKDFFENASYDNFEPQNDSDVFGEKQQRSPKINENANIDPGAITLIQSTFLEKIREAFSVVANYALALLYYFAALELVVFGLIWALQRDVGWDKLFFKIIKIGLILFIIRNYPWLLNAIIQSFARIADVVVSNSVATECILNPAKIWQYGYDSGIYLLKLAANGNNFGIIMVQISLGMGILLTFALLGIQMVVQMIGFYIVALGALILLPFGTFTLSRGMFDKAVQAVLQAGIRLMALTIVIGVAVVVWDGFKLTDLATVPKFNINQSLGLFFTALLFLVLAVYLPRFLSQAVGSLSSGALDNSPSSSAVTHESGVASVVTTDSIGNMKVATTIEAASTNTIGGYAPGGHTAAIGGAATPASVVITPGGSGSVEAKMAKGTLVQASNISKSISESTVKKIKEAVLQAVKEKK